LRTLSIYSRKAFTHKNERQTLVLVLPVFASLPVDVVDLLLPTTLARPAITTTSHVMPSHKTIQHVALVIHKPKLAFKASTYPIALPLLEVPFGAFAMLLLSHVVDLNLTI